MELAGFECKPKLNSFYNIFYIFGVKRVMKFSRPLSPTWPSFLGSQHHSL